MERRECVGRGDSLRRLLILTLRCLCYYSIIKLRELVPLSILCSCLQVINNYNLLIN